MTDASKIAQWQHLTSCQAVSECQSFTCHHISALILTFVLCYGNKNLVLQKVAYSYFFHRVKKVQSV